MPGPKIVTNPPPMAAPAAERHAKAMAKVELEIKRLDGLIEQQNRRISQAQSDLGPLEAELAEWTASKDALEADREVTP